MKRTIVFMVTNGVGLGHLTRGLAVAKRMKRLDPNLEIIFFSTSLASDVIRNEGFLFYYIPARTSMPENVTASLWNDYLKKQLQHIVDTHQPVAIIFDGAYPYGGVIANIKQYKTLISIWIKREGYKKNSSKLETLEPNFNLVIIPKETGRDYGFEAEPTSNRIYCSPIVLLDKEEAKEREIVRRSLGIQTREQLFYVQLGAGNINDIKMQCQIILKCILKSPDNVVLLGESIIGEEFSIRDSRIKVIRSYPNAQYFKGVDFAVSAVGYNTFHELLYFEVPSLFIPNLNTVKDDQLARAQLAEEKGVALCLKEVKEEFVDDAIRKLCREKEKMKHDIRKIREENGALEAAQQILNII